MLKRTYIFSFLFSLLLFSIINAQVDPNTAPKASIDRFSPDAGHLFIRDAMNGLPGPNMPIDFDKGSFITKGLGPNGELISYYNFDVMPLGPAPIYVLFKEGESAPVTGQMNIIDVIPGDSGYSDFWQVVKVTVPSNYSANTVTSFSEIMSNNYTMEKTTTIVNCPVVPEGSTARLRWTNESTALTLGWYKGMVVFYFNFTEKSLSAVNDMVPLSPIYVSFNINPDQPGGGPPSGFVAEEKTGRVHNVVETLPEDAGYSPLWMVNVYDNKDFWNVHDLTTATAANRIANGVANVNCPVVARYVDNIDRFSSTAGHLFVRDTINNFPEPNKPVDFDLGPFITKGLGPNGKKIAYYNFDVMPLKPAPIYVLFREGESAAPVAGQMNIIDVVPGDTNYNDFWEVNKVTVPATYVANTVKSFDEIKNNNYPIMETTSLVNCPVVPEGSTAKWRLTGESPELTEGWYKGKIVYYFNFLEKPLNSVNDMIPLSPIYVAFNINPDQPGGGPPSGFVTEPSSDQTHNVASTLPSDAAYSPLWMVNVYDNKDFNSVMDLNTALAANRLADGVANVNCPVVMVEGITAVRENSEIPAGYELSQNYPNPFNPTTEISFKISHAGKVQLKVFDILGMEVATLVDEVLAPGAYRSTFSAGRSNLHGELASGIYFYQLRADGFVTTKKMLLMK